MDIGDRSEDSVGALTVRANTRADIVSIVIIQTVASLAMWLSPLVVGAVIDHLAFSTAEAGWMASADVSGVMMATLIALVWIRRASWQFVAKAALLLLIACNLLSALMESFEWLFPIRILAGMASGCMMAIGGSVLGASARPERNIALFTGVQLATVSVCLLVLPGWVNSLGTSAIYLLLAMLIFACLPALKFLPASSVGTTNIPHEPAKTQVQPADLILLTLFVLPGFLFHVGVSAVWAYAERLTFEAGLTTSQSGEVLAVAMYAGILGSFMAFLAGMKMGRGIPLTLVLAIQLSGLFLLMGTDPGLKSFFLALGLLGFSFNFVVGYQFGLAVGADASRLAPVAYLLMLQAGMVCGPLLASLLIEAGDHRPAMWLAAWFFAASYIWSMTLVLIVKNRSRPG